MKMSTALKREHDFVAKWARRLSESIEFVIVKMSTALKPEHDF